jgi:hypothetical protein
MGEAMELVGSGWLPAMYVFFGFMAVISLVLAWVAWRFLQNFINALSEVAGISKELRAIDSRLTAIAKSSVSIEAHLERQKTGSHLESPLDQGRARPKIVQVTHGERT